MFKRAVYNVLLAGAVMLLFVSGVFGNEGAEVELSEEGPGSPRVVRTIDSANPEPPIYDWHYHNRLGIERGQYAGVESFNRVLIRKETGEVVPVPFFHFTLRDLGEIFKRMAQFPEQTYVIDYEETDDPLIHLTPDELESGELERWPNRGVLGGEFHSMNPISNPQVKDVQGRRAVRFDHNQWYKDTEFNNMVLDTMPEDALRDGDPFTYSAWVLHPDSYTGKQSSVMLSWHTRGGDDGTSLDFQRVQRWGSFAVDGLGADIRLEEGDPAEPMPEWTHLTYVYTGGGVDGELRIYEDGHLVAVAGSDYVPELLEPSEINPDSATLRGRLHVSDPDAEPYIWGFIGEYDAYKFPQLRHIGRWGQSATPGRRGEGEFEITFDDLKPGTRYYYRIFAQDNPITNQMFKPNMERTRRWAIGSRSFVTPEEDENAGEIIPPDEDRYFFLGSKWGSRWYAVFGGPAAFYMGYLGEVKLYDYAMDDEQVRREAGGHMPFGETPEDGAEVGVDRTDFSWERGSANAESYVLYLDTDQSSVEEAASEAIGLDDSYREEVSLEPGRTHYWRVDQLDGEGELIEEGPVWSFHVSYGEAEKSVPEEGSTVQPNGFFRWSQAVEGLKRQRLFVEEDKQAVLESDEPVADFDEHRRDYRTELDPGVKYYWRVENELKDGTVIPGPVWSFETAQYFKAEFDGPVTEPYPQEHSPGRPARIIEGMGHPTITNPGADEESIRDIAHATKRFLRKSRQLRNHLAARPAATTMATPDGGAPYVHPYVCGSYGGLPGWNMTMHEMGHQVEMHGMTTMDPDFWDRLEHTFNLRVDTNFWMGDYAAVNLHENVACAAHDFICARRREMLYNEDPPTYHLLSDYMPGDLTVELHPAGGLDVDEDNVVTGWENRAGTEGRRGEGYAPMPEMVGSFEPAGSPRLTTSGGVAAVDFDGESALVWDRELQYGFEDNRPWSVECWARYDDELQGRGLLVGWGPEDRGVRVYLGAGEEALSVGGEILEWPEKPESGRWHHIAAVYEGGDMEEDEGELRLYLNGEQVLSEVYELDLEGEMPVYIGGRALDEEEVEEGFEGVLANVRVHDYDLSEDQVVEQHYMEEREGYERTLYPHSAGELLVDLDAKLLRETGGEHIREPHRPLYPESLNKPWVRSWSNRGMLGGRVHNDVEDEVGHYSGSTPLYREVEGIQAIRFMGKDRMVGVMDVKGEVLREPAGTLEMVVYRDEQQPEDEVVLQWGDFTLEAADLEPGWQHLAVVAEENESLVYINGEHSGNIDGVLAPQGRERMHFGAYYDYSRASWYRYFNGAIASVRIHQDRLDQDQIRENAMFSPVKAAHSPEPAHGAEVAPDRGLALDWSALQPGEEPVKFGESLQQMEEVGSFEPGQYQPELSGYGRYYWQVGEGPVWYFETGMGKAIDLSAENLEEGALSEWENEGALEGEFESAEREEVVGVETLSMREKPAFRMEEGVRLAFEDENGEPENVLETGEPFTIAFHATTEQREASVPMLNWGEGDERGRLWFGTHSADDRLLTYGGEKPRSSDENYPDDQLALVYPEQCRGRLAYTWTEWKSVAVTFDGEEAEIWYDGEPYSRVQADLSLADSGELTLGWESEDVDSTVLLSELHIYDRVLDAEQIAQLYDEDGDAAENPVIHVSAEDKELDELFSTVDNPGVEGGAFVLRAGQQEDRRAEVQTVNGRNAVVFDGEAMLASDFVLPERLADARPFTVEVWAAQEEPGGRLMAFSQQITERHTSFAMGDGGGGGALIRRHSAASWQRGIDQEQMGEWMHLAWVYEGGKNSTVRLYRNGELDSVHDYKTVDTIAGYPLTIGGIMTPDGDHEGAFRGAISDIRVYDYPRSSSEIENAAENHN